DPAFVRRNCGDLSGSGCALFLSHTASQHDHVTNSSLQLIGKIVEMFISFREHERRAAVLDGLNYILADAAIPRFLADEFPVERIKLDTLVRRRRHCWLKG